MAAENKEKRKYKKKVMWTARQEEYLVELWAERIDGLRGARRNLHIYEEMRLELEKIDLFVSSNDIKIKIHNLSAKYRKEKQLVGPSGGSPSVWPLFKKLHAFLGNFRINNIEMITEDSIINTDSINVQYEDVAYIEELESYSEVPSPVLMPLSQISPTSSDGSASASASDAGSAKKRRKFNNFQTEILKKIDDIQEQIEVQSDHLKETDQKIYELELRKTNMLEQFVTESSNFKKSLLNFLNSQNN